MRLRALAFSLILVVSIIGGSVALAGTVSAAPGGMVGVPSDNVQDVRASSGPLDASSLVVYTDDHADTTEVSIVTEGQANAVGSGTPLPDVANERICENPGKAAQKNPNVDCDEGDVSLVLSDDVNHDGRTVAIDASQLEEALGTVPGFVTIRNSQSGEEWRQPTKVEDGWVFIEAPHFSDNAVTWGGSVQIGDTFTDGGQVQYDVQNLDSASDVTVNLTGKINEEWENKSFSNRALGKTINTTYGGNMDTDGPDGSDNASVEVTSLSQPGNYSEVAVNGDGNAETNSSAVFLGYSGGKNPRNGAIEIQPNKSGTLSEITINFSEVSPEYNLNYNIALSNGGLDSDFGNGTTIKSDWNPQTTPGEQTVVLDNPISVTAGSVYELEFTTGWDSADEGGFYLWVDQSTGDRWATDDNYIGYQSRAGTPDIDLGIDGTKNASLSTNTGDSVTIGDLSYGQTTTTKLELTPSTSELYTNGTGAVNISIIAKERTQTEDPGVELNDGNWANHTGTLADGETVEYTLSKETLQQGTNTLNVSMADDLSADAPAMQVAVDYTHDAEDDQLVSYDGAKFYERYNVSKTYSSDRANPELVIPFDNTVAKIDSAEYRVNGGTWQSTDQTVLSGTTATIHLPDVNAGDTIDVRANGSRVAAENGAITVTQPTAVGERLDTKFEIDSYDSRGDLTFLVGDSLDAGQAHYVYNATWTPDEYNEIDSSGNHELHMPNAAQANSAYISTIPVSAEPATNEVRIRVEDPQTSQPVFDVSPGATEGDGVAFTYLNAADDTDYELYSQTRGVVVDSGTANSPITLHGDDSEGTLQFLLGSTDASSTGSDPFDVVVGPIPDTSGTIVDIDFTSLSWLFVLGGGGLLFLGLIYWRRGPDEAATVASGASQGAASGLTQLARWIAMSIAQIGRWIGSGATGTVTWLRRHPAASTALAGMGAISLFAAGVFEVPDGAGVFVLITGAPLISWTLLRRWGDQSLVVWGGTTVAAIIVGLQLLGTDLFAIIFESQAGVIAMIGLIGLAYYALKTYRTEASTPDEQTNVSFELQSDGGEEDDDR